MPTDERWRNVDENSYLEESCRLCIKVDERERKKEEGGVLEREAERKEGEEVDIKIEERWGGDKEVQERVGKGPNMI